METLCPWNGPSFLVVSENTPPYLLYSHGIAIVFALLFAFLLLYRNRTLLTTTFFFVASAFSLWTFFDLIQWATNRPDVLLFFWSINIVLEIFVYAAAFYLTLVFIRGVDIKTRYKYLLLLPAIPLLALIPTNILLPGVDISTCNALESQFVIIYSYAVESAFMLAIVIASSINLIRVSKEKGKESWTFIAGIVLFLLAFSSGNIIGSLTDNWQLAQYGLFGMPIFIGFLMYGLIRYKSFNTKMFGAQILVIALGALVLSVQFGQTVGRMRIIAGITFVFVCFVGFALVRSVRREVKQREKLEELSHQLERTNSDLESANDKLKGIDKLKTEFLSLASHQLRSPLTAIKGYASMLIEGSFGAMQEPQEMGVKRIYASAQGLVSLVEDLLNVSKIEQGGMKYEMMEVDLGKIAKDLYEEMKIPAQNKKLDFSIDLGSMGQTYPVFADPTKIKQVLLNLTDNSIKYTQQGFVKLAVTKDDKNVTFSVVDSGIGISPETKAKLFEKFSRGEGSKINTGGSGLGLYLAKEIAKAHKGEVVIESEGLGKGSAFKVVLPIMPGKPNS